MSNEKNDFRTTYYGVAVAFLAAAVVFWITMDNKAIALPFGVLGVTFAVLAYQRKGGRDAEPNGDPDGDRDPSA